MKKRVKLLTTIASLCLAVALMAFGVYAATQVGFNAKSTISFAAQEIEGKWTLQINNTDYDAQTGYDAENGKHANSGYYKTAVLVLDSEKDDTTDNGKPVGPTDNLTGEGVTYEAVDVNKTAVAISTLVDGKATVVYTLVFENTGDGKADASVTFTDINVTGYSVSATAAKNAEAQADYDSGDSIVDLVTGDKVTFVITVELDTTATGFNAAKNVEDTINIAALAVDQKA